METGYGLFPLRRALEKSHMSFDVATIAFTSRATTDEAFEKDKQAAENLIGASVYYGQRLSKGQAPVVYKNYRLGGVTKDASKTFAFPTKKDFWLSRNSSAVEMQQDINSARKDIELIASKIAQWYQLEDSQQET